MSRKHPDSSPRVLHVTSALDPGGIETWLLRLARYTGGTSLIDTVLVLGDHDGLLAPQFRELGVTIERVDPTLSSVSFVREVVRTLRRTGPWDVLHSHVYWRSALLHLASAYCGVSLRITHSHNDGPERSGMSRAFAFPAESACRSVIGLLSHELLACTETAARSLFGSGVVDRDACTLLPYGMDQDVFWRLAETGCTTRADLGIPEDALVIGHIGRFMPQKNHEYLLRVAAEARKKDRRMHFLLVGDGPLRQSMEHLANTLGITAHTTFTGNRLDVPSLIVKCMDCFFFPSRWEGLGIVLLEAQLAGKPCYFSDRIPPEANIFPEDNRSFSLALSPGVCAEGLVEFATRKRCEKAVVTPRNLPAAYQIEHNAAVLRSVYTGGANAVDPSASRSPHHEQLA